MPSFPSLFNFNVCLLPAAGGGWHNAELRRALEPFFPEPALQGALDQALAEVEASTSAGWV